MALLYLIRHAASDSVGRWLANAVPGLGLNAEGREQARSLAERLGEVPIKGVYSSPLARARQTAEAIAAPRGLDVRVLEGLTETAFGSWAERPFAELDLLPEWKAWNVARSFGRPPGGESPAEVLARSLREIERVVAERPEGSAALVSHGDVLRSVLSWALGAPIDLLTRMELEPASISVLDVRPGRVRVLGLNDTGRLAAGGRVR